MPIRLAVCVSGRGSNLFALLDALAGSRDAEVVLVLSDRATAPALARARERGLEVECLSNPADAGEWLSYLRGAEVDLVVLAGFLKLVPPAVVAAYRGRIMNIHPALLPSFGGPGMYGRRVHQAVIDSGATESGATVHLVDEEYDRGQILAQARVPVRPDDTPETLAARVLEAEHRLLPAVVLHAVKSGRPAPVPDSE